MGTKALITEQYLTDTADAIREKLDVSTTYTPDEFAAAILSITGGGSTVIVTEEPDTGGGVIKNIVADTVIDISQDTVDAAHLVYGYTAHDKSGDPVAGEYVVPTPRTSSDVTVSGDTVTVTAGAYSDDISKSVASGSAATPTTSITANPAITVGSDGLITASVSASQSVTPTVSAGYISSGTAGTITVSGSNTEQLTARTSSDLSSSGATVTAPAGYYDSDATKTVSSGSVTVPSTISGTGAAVTTGTNILTLTKTLSVTPNVTTAGYISSGTAGNTDVSLQASVNTRSSLDLTVSGATVTAPAGYYSSAASTSVASGTEGTPVATKGTVSNHSISITPSVTNSAGYISGSTKTGTAVSVSASELVSGSQTITSNNTYDVTNLESVVVNVSGSSGPELKLLKTYSMGTLSTSSTSATDTGKSTTLQTYNGYDLLIVDVSVDTPTNNRHTSTVSTVYLTGTSDYQTKNTYTVGSNKWNSKLSSSGTGTTRQSTTAYGIYVNSASASNGQLTLTFYYRYNNNNTGTINGTYTARVYGVKLYDLIGG